jgi:hypothetical protein
MPNTFTLISSATVGSGGAATISFSSIPSTYTDLLLKLSVRDTSTGPGNFQNMQLTFNGSSASNYYDRLLYGNGSSALSASLGPTAKINTFYSTSAGATANTFANTDIYIPNYAGTTNKSVSIDGVTETNGNPAIAYLDAALWSNTAAITSLSIALDSGNFVQYSTAYLYGIVKS